MGGVKPGTGAAAWRLRLHEVIFEADTRAGRAFHDRLVVRALRLSAL